MIVKWLFQKRDGLTTTCSYCGSTAIKFYNAVTADKIVDGVEVKHYNSNYVCQKCGAMAYAEEVWSTKENINKMKSGEMSNDKL
jgi:uncharacterized protein with PIN domain